jgi:sensor histidine kinase YesM
VAVRAERRGSSLVLTVEDDGPGLQPGASGDGPRGLGLANTRARLERLYGDAAALEVTNRPEGGAYVGVRLPLRTGAAAHAAALVTPLAPTA